MADFSTPPLPQTLPVSLRGACGGLLKAFRLCFPSKHLTYCIKELQGEGACIYVKGVTECEQRHIDEWKATAHPWVDGRWDYWVQEDPSGEGGLTFKLVLGTLLDTYRFKVSSLRLECQSQSWRACYHRWKKISPILCERLQKLLKKIMYVETVPSGDLNVSIGEASISNAPSHVKVTVSGVYEFPGQWIRLLRSPWTRLIYRSDPFRLEIIVSAASSSSSSLDQAQSGYKRKRE